LEKCNEKVTKEHENWRKRENQSLIKRLAYLNQRVFEDTIAFKGGKTGDE